jgi:alkylation response protein AidB-like acyl-CoA dehydrogenase
MKEELKQLGQEFAQNELLEKWDVFDEYSPIIVNEILAKASEIGIFSSCIDEDLGGSNFSPSDFGVLLKEISTGSGGIALLFYSHLLGITPILFAKDKKRQNELLQEICKSEEKNKPILFSMAACEENVIFPKPENIKTKCIEKNGTYVLSGRKTNVIGALFASCFTVLAKTNDESFVWLLVKKDSPGLEIKAEKAKTGLRVCPVNEIVFNQTVIQQEDILLRSNTLSELHDYYKYVELSLASVAIGMAKQAYKLGFKYAMERYQGGKIICDHDTIKMMLADMALALESANSMNNSNTDAFLCSAYAVMVAEKICLDSIQIHGGYGYMKDYKVERILRDVKTLQAVINPHSRKMKYIENVIKKHR